MRIVRQNNVPVCRQFLLTSVAEFSVVLWNPNDHFNLILVHR